MCRKAKSFCLLVRAWGVDDAVLVQHLAAEAQLPTFTGSLSSIAEYCEYLYRSRMELGEDAFVQNVQFHLPRSGVDALLYRALAMVQAELVLVSVAYDDGLEQAFRAAGKRFVELAPIIRRGDGYDIGHVLVSFSDGREPVAVHTREALSGMRLYELGYSLIFKMRGSCPAGVSDFTVRRSALTLTETDYFNFARHAGQMIPDYLASHIRSRGVLFVGYQPRQWEERLLAGILLERRDPEKPCYVIGGTPEPLEVAYWKARKVEHHRLDVQELDRYLQEEVA